MKEKWTLIFVIILSSLILFSMHVYKDNKRSISRFQEQIDTDHYDMATWMKSWELGQSEPEIALRRIDQIATSIKEQIDTIHRKKFLTPEIKSKLLSIEYLLLELNSSYGQNIKKHQFFTSFEALKPDKRIHSKVTVELSNMLEQEWKGLNESIEKFPSHMIFPSWIFSDMFTGKDPRPNVVLLVVDSMRIDHLSFFGYQYQTTPFLDFNFTDSVVFNNSIALSSAPHVSTASILSGKSPFRHKLLRAGHWSSDKSLVKVFLDNDYYTAGVSANPLVSRKTGFQAYFNSFTALPMALADTTVREGIRQVDSRKNKDPFFLFINLSDLQTAIMESGVLFTGNPSRRYDATIGNVDYSIKMLYQYLEKTGQLDNTIFAITGSCGAELLERGRIGNAHSLHVETLRVPLIIKPAAGFADSFHSTDNPVSNAGVLPAIIDAIGLEVDNTFASPEYNIADDSKHIVSVSYFDEPANNVVKFAGMFALTTPEFKLIMEGGTGRYLMYDLKNDPAETTDITRDLRYEEKFKIYRFELDEALKDFRVDKVNIGENSDMEKLLEESGIITGGYYPPESFEQDVAPQGSGLN